MTLPARAAALRGDDYQHVVGLFHACRALTDDRIDSISIEDASGGAFDDVVIRMRPAAGRPHEYIQVKSSNYRSAVIDENWLLTAKTANGLSPLQHFHRTWRALTAAGEPFILTLLSNRNFDHNDPLLATIDNTTDKIPHAALHSSTPRSKAGRAAKQWADHLNITITQLNDFLGEVRFVHGESDSSWEDRSRALMRNAGLRDDDDAVAVGRAMIRGWVTAGRGMRTRDDIRAEVTHKNLLARDGTLVLAVHAIDHAIFADLPNVTVDVVDLYPDLDPFQRRQLRDPADWNNTVLPELTRAKADLSAFRSRRVHTVGAMRLPMHFAIGRTLPDVGKWVLSTDQNGAEWCSAAERDNADTEVVHHEQLRSEGDLAVAIALTHDPTSEVHAYITESALPVKTLLVLSTPTGPGHSAVPGPGWAVDWTFQAREIIRRTAHESDSSAVHLFISAPAAIAMFLGHRWNMIPTTTVYEHRAPGYEPTMIFPG